MPVPGLDAERCQRRNALAARRGLNSVTVALATRPPGPIDTSDPKAALRVITAKGKLPRDMAGALERINALRGDGAEPLTEDQVWVAYMEAGNSNFVSKFQFHLGATTLRNIAGRASAGGSIAFMNSHRHGGMSTPAELPYGRTFAGRFEQSMAADGRLFSRTLLGVYMVRGLRPNGVSGPSTDDLYAGIKAGTIFDVSLGLVGGDEICDVCGNDLRLYDPEADELVCPHVPGTHHKMTDDEIAAQLARGVPDGVASFTLENATAPEVSAVYDGALPGAGFRKALSMSRHRQLSAASLDEARLAYAPLVGRGDFDPSARRRRPARTEPPTRGEPDMAKPSTTTINLADAYRFWKAAGEPDTINLDDFAAAVSAAPAKPAAAAPAQPSTPPQPAAPAPQPNLSAGDADPRITALQEQTERLERQLEAERTARQQETEAQRRATFRAQGEAWALTQVRSGAAIPAEADELTALYAQAAWDDHSSPVPVAYRDATNTPRTGTRVQALSALWGKRGRHDFSREHVAATGEEQARDAAGNPNPPAGPRPMFELADLPGQPSRDPLGDQMVASAKEWAGRRNGTAKS